MERTSSRSIKTKNALLIAALEEFAKRGVAATSIAKLTSQSGAKNVSAIHYHFGSKKGLVEALIVFVQDWFDAQREIELRSIESLVQSGYTPDLAPVLEAVLRPYGVLMEQEPWGFSAIRFLALLEFEEEHDFWQLLVQRSSLAFGRILNLVRMATPHLEEEDRALKLRFYIDSIIYGFASHRYLNKSPESDRSASAATDADIFYIDFGLRLFSELRPHQK